HRRRDRDGVESKEPDQRGRQIHLQLSTSDPMAAHQHPVEVILARGFTSNLATPAFLVDDQGNLIFYNEAAGELLGVRFEEAGPMGPREWGGRFSPTDLDGAPLALDELPLAIALSQARPAHR